MNLQSEFFIVSSRKRIEKGISASVGRSASRLNITKETQRTCQCLFRAQEPQWCNYKLPNSGINPADSTLGLAIWQETFWPKSEVVLK